MWYVSLVGLSALFFWLLSRKHKKPVIINDNMLHGHDMDKWHYLGFIELKLNEIEYPTFLFASKEDLSRRSYTIKGINPDQVQKYHSYVSKYLDPWSKGEYEIYALIKSPSRFLADYMLDNFSCVWDKETQWWKTSDDAMYKAEQKKQSTKKTPPNQGSGGQKNPVVIQVDFGKKNED